MDSRQADAMEARARNVVPLFAFLSFSETRADTSDESTIIAKAVLTPEGIAPWTALHLYTLPKEESRLAMITAPWCDKKEPISTLLTKWGPQIEALLTTQGLAFTVGEARRPLALYPSFFVEHFAGDNPTDDTPITIPSYDVFVRYSTRKKCAFLAILTYKEEYLTEILEAMFVSLASFTKGDNATSDWIQKRLNQFRRTDKAFDAIKTPTHALISRFSSIYLPNKVTEAQYCEVLRLHYQKFRTTVKSTRRFLGFPERFLEAGCWLVEQAPGLNCAPLQAIAELITKRRLSYCILLNLFPIEHELVAVCRAMYTKIRSPFASIKRPTVPVRQYPTLAFLCCSLCYGTAYNTTSLEAMTRYKLDVFKIVEALTPPYRNSAGYAAITMRALQNSNTTCNNGSLDWPNTLSTIIEKHATAKDLEFITLCRAFLSATQQRRLNTDTLASFCERAEPQELTQALKTSLGIPNFEQPLVLDNVENQYTTLFDPVAVAEQPPV